MQNSRLIKVISHLTKQDIRALKKFLRSPYFNQRADVTLLFDEIINLLGLKKPIFSPPLIYDKLYPQKKFSQQDFRLVMSYLMQLIERYLFIQEIEKDQGLSKIMVTQSYKNRNLPLQMQRTIKEGIQSFEKQPLRNANWYWQHFQLQFEHLYFEAKQAPTAPLNRQQLSDMLDIGYLISKLRQTILMLSHQTVYKSKYDIHLLEEIITFLDGHAYLENPAIAIYYHSYFIVAKLDEDEHFKILKELLLTKGDVFTKGEIRDLYILAINHCIKQTNLGKDYFYAEALDFYKKGLEEEYYLQNGILSRFTYYNIVKAGIKTEDYDWVEYFINNYKNNLERKFRESSYSFSLGQLEYHRKNYDEALSLLQKTNYRDIPLNLGTKIILLKIYFETDQFDLLDSHLEAMKSFIRRKRIIGYHQKNYLNIVKYAGKLLSVNRYDNQEKAALKAEIQAAEPLAEKEWLLEQVDNL